MARNLSAMKYHRQSERRRTIHRSQKTMIRTFSKKAVEAAESGDAENVGTALHYEGSTKCQTGFAKSRGERSRGVADPEYI